jgi:hypothetical protein
MKLIYWFFHQIIFLYYKKLHFQFVTNSNNLKNSQLNILKKIYQNKFTKKLNPNITNFLNYENLTSKYSLTTYESYEKIINKELTNKKTIYKRFQPTSGSTSNRKWIPYSEDFSNELDRAIGPWLYDLYSKYPKLKLGRHYWSLSWMPTELREQLSSLDDLDLFPWWQRIIMKFTMACPNSVANAKTSDAAQLATITWLCSCRDLTMLFVWSPTFGLSLFNCLLENKNKIIKFLETGQWVKMENELLNIPCPKSISSAKVLKELNQNSLSSVLNQLWPNLVLISSWDTSSSEKYAKELQKLFPKSHFQGKGLFATEAVVTIPFQNQFLLSYRSHFYEFKCLDTNRVYPSWKLKKDMRVCPIITTGSGFLRYQMQDELIVKGFHKNIPDLKFINRLGHVDLVGEKLSYQYVSKLISDFNHNFQQTNLICLLAIHDSKPHYIAVLETNHDQASQEEKQFLDNNLNKNFHYNLAVDLKQLSPLKTFTIKNTNSFYQAISKIKNIASGDFKANSIFTLTPNEFQKLTVALLD